MVGVKKNPALSVVTDMLALMRQYAVEFGMTPSSRSRIEAGREDEALSPLMAMVKAHEQSKAVDLEVQKRAQREPQSPGRRAR